MNGNLKIQCLSKETKMADIKGRNTNSLRGNMNNVNDRSTLELDIQELSKTGIQKAKESIDFLRFSEGLVRRDIDLIRIQLEIKLKKLESRLQAELRNLVETETSRLEKFVADVKALEDRQFSEDTVATVAKLKAMVTSIEHKRLKFEVNKSLENSLNEITFFGKIILQQVTDPDSPPGSENKQTTEKTTKVQNGIRQISLGLSDPKGSKLSSNDNRHVFSNANELSKVPQQRKAQRASSVSSDRQFDHSIEVDRILDQLRESNNRYGTLPRTAKHKLSNNSEPDNDIALKTVESEGMVWEQVHKNSDKLTADSQQVLGSSKMKPKSVYNQSGGPGRPDADIDSEDKGEEWLKADPFSVLRALKLQTAKTEENLKAIRKSHKEDKQEVEPETTRDLRKSQIKMDLTDDSNQTAENSSIVFKNYYTKPKSTNSLQNRIPTAPKRNGYQFDCNPYELEKIDKVTRANELWFGRDRRKKEHDSNKRRARSLSPKTVRFQMEYAENTEVDGKSDLDSNLMTNDTHSGKWDYDDTATVKPLRNHNLHPIQRSEDIKSTTRNSHKSPSSTAAKGTDLNCQSRPDVGRNGELTKYLSTDFKHNPLYVRRQSTYSGDACMLENKRHNNKEEFEIPNTRKGTNGVRKCEHSNDEAEIESGQLNFKREESALSVKDVEKRVTNDTRLQRLRNKRLRNRTIGVVSDLKHGVTENSISPQTDAVSIKSFDLTAPSISNVYSPYYTFNSSHRQLTKVPIINNEYPLPFQSSKLNEENCNRYPFQESPPMRDSSPDVFIEVKRSDGMLVSEPANEELSSNCSKLVKVKTERQRIPSYREMLFLD